MKRGYFDIGDELSREDFDVCNKRESNAAHLNPYRERGDKLVAGDDNSREAKFEGPTTIHIHEGPQSTPPDEPKKTPGGGGNGNGKKGLIITIIILIAIIVVGGCMYLNMMNSNNSSVPYFPPSTADTQTYVQPTYAQSTYVQQTYVQPTYVQPTITYTVRFDTGGYGSISPQTVNEGGYVSRPSSLYRDGYEFSGWYTTPACTTPWSFGTQIYNDMTLYAKWDAIQGLTASNPCLIYTASELVNMESRPDYYYKLMANIDLSDYSWFDYTAYGAHLNMNGYKVTYGSGTSESPYLISSSEAFRKIYDDLSAHYKLTEDISLNGISIPSSGVFTGSLDGNGHTITGKYSTDISIGDATYSSPKYFGLFSENAGTIKNLKLVSFTISTSSDMQGDGSWVYAGAITGKNSGTISNVKVQDCSITCKRAGSAIGFIAGHNIGKIEQSSVIKGRLMGHGDGGGVAGHNEGVIVSCSVTGNGVGTSSSDTQYEFLNYYMMPIPSTAAELFGGHNYGANSGYGKSWGGIVGYATSTSIISDVSVRDMFVTVYISGINHGGTVNSIGTIVGHNQGTVSGSYSVSNVRENYGRGSFATGDTTNHISSEESYCGWNEGTTPW